MRSSVQATQEASGIPENRGRGGKHAFSGAEAHQGRPQGWPACGREEEGTHVFSLGMTTVQDCLCHVVAPVITVSN